VRFHSKLQLILGLAGKITKASGADQVPAVRETLGKLAAWEGMLDAAIHGQIQSAEEWPTEGFMCFNRRFQYAALNWCTENHSIIIDQLRELCGGSVFQMPADISVMGDAHMRSQFEKYWTTPQTEAVERMKLYKLAWDLTGSEFAGRHQQYEKFYAGASFVVRNYNYMHTDWKSLEGVAEHLMSSYGVPAEYL
jgi:4-hydroxyphenylacetate 3-monooxygenase